MKSWGVSSERATYSPSWYCPCGWGEDLSSFIEKWAEYVVGLDQRNELNSVNRPKIRVILECPKCFEKFWFHLIDDHSTIKYIIKAKNIPFQAA